jgi:hypothetical protein
MLLMNSTSTPQITPVIPIFSLYLCGKNEFAHSADCSLVTAEPTSAVDIREHFASFVSFQRIQPSIPFAFCVISAAFRRLPACHFGGKNAIIAQIVFLNKRVANC